MEAKRYVREVRQLVRIASREGNQDVRDALETAIRGYVYSNQPAAYEQALANYTLAQARIAAAKYSYIRAEQVLDHAAVMGNGIDAINAILDFRHAQDEYRSAQGELQSAKYWLNAVSSAHK